MQGSDPEVQVRAELEQIMPLVSALTGLATRWSGVVELVETTEFKGKKRFSCDIQIQASLARQDARWSTLIHESLHAHSTGYNGPDYRLSRGWEEGAVEGLQRLLRPEILFRLGVVVSQADLLESDRQHPFNDRIQALEAIRQSLAAPEMEFYKQLLATPIAQRPGETLAQIRQLPMPQQREALYTYSASNAVLKKFPLS